jgi:hypothetical protein
MAGETASEAHRICAELSFTHPESVERVKCASVVIVDVAGLAVNPAAVE